MITLPKDARSIITTLQNAGFEAYAVGGSVRDSIIGKVTKGWDFTTNATPEAILALFPDSFYDNQFGTVGIKIYNHVIPAPEPESSDYKEWIPDQVRDDKPIDIYEITTYRSEKEYSDFRHPDNLTWGKTILEDLSRRDFTMNAIATDGDSIIDPYDGQKDIQQKIIRTVGDPNKRFAEDALRMIRAVRFAAQLGFAIEEKTNAAISANASLIAHISAERIRDEFFKILVSDYCADSILVLKNCGLLTLLLPELVIAFDTPQKSPKRHHVYDVGTHSIQALKFCPSKNPVVRLATLLHDLGKPKTMRVLPDGVITFYNHELVSAKIAKNVAARLRLSNKQTDLLYTLVRWHQFSVDERQTDSAIRRFIRHVGKENLEHILALRIGDRLGGGALETSWRLELYKRRLEEVQLQPFTVADLAVDGHDVMNIFAVKPGRIIGDVLDQLFAEVEKGTLQNDRDILIQKLHALKQTFSSETPTDPKA